MSPLALLLAVALQGAPSHAAFHSPDVDLFLEVPDVQALLDAYDQAPMLRLLRDEGTAEAVRQLSGAEFHFDLQLRNLLGSSLPPGATDLVDSAQALSFSVRIPQGCGDDPEAGPPIPVIAAVIDFATTEDAQATQTMLVDLVGDAQPDPTSPFEGTQTFSIDPTSGITAWVATRGPRLLLGGGTHTPADFARRMASEEGVTSLANDPRYAAGRGHFEPPTGATVIQGFTTRSPLDLFADGGPSEALGSLELLWGGGEDFLAGARCWRMQLAGDRFVTEIVTLDSGESTSDASIFGTRAIDPTWLAPVRGDSMLTYSSSLDGGALHERFRGFLASMGEDAEATEAIAALEGNLGFGLEEFFALLGPGMAASVGPIPGIALPDTYVWFDLVDPVAFQDQLGILVENLGTTFPEFSLRTRAYKVKNKTTGERIPFPVTTLGLPPGLIELGPLGAPTPALTVTEGKLLLSLSSMRLKRELKRLYGGEETPSETPALLQAHGFDLPADARSVIVMDWGLLIDGLLSLARNLGPLASMFGGGLELPFDPAALPDSELVTQFIQPTFHYSRRVEGATYRRHEASFGPETWVGGGLAVYLGFRTVAGPGMIPPTEIVSPEEVFAEAEEIDSHAESTGVALQNLRTGVAIYKLEHKAYPEGLDALLQPTPSFPEGVLGLKELPDDGWGRSFRYERTADGTAYRLWSVGPNGIDENEGGDDVSGT